MLPFALSPSRASDFMLCPRLFKFRAIDRVPEPPSLPATRGTIVHLALQRLFELPRVERDIDAALSILHVAWSEAIDAELRTELFDSEQAEAAALRAAEEYVRNYFQLEDPRLLEPAGRELRLRATVSDGLELVGILDRLDRGADGGWAVSDYKTGRAPQLERSQAAFFGMQVYSVLVREVCGEVPSKLRLLYLDAGESYVLEPTEQSVTTTTRKLVALGSAIGRAMATGDWRTRASRFCDVCSYRGACPAFTAGESGGRAPAAEQHAGVAS